MLAAYQTVQVSTAEPARLLLMLLDGGARYLDQALRALERGDHAAFAERTSQAYAVISELAVTLDHARGGEIGRSLDRLYDFMLRHLTLALPTRDAGAVGTVRSLLETIRAGFEGAVTETRRAGRA